MKVTITVTDGDEPGMIAVDITCHREEDEPEDTPPTVAYYTGLAILRLLDAEVIQSLIPLVLRDVLTPHPEKE